MDNSYQDKYEKAFIDTIKFGTGIVVITHPNNHELIQLAEDNGYVVITEDQLPKGIQGNAFDLLILDEISSAIKERVRVVNEVSTRVRKIDSVITHWTYPVYKAEPFVHNKPVKKIPIKQAPRQSFRQSMRSVNRNR